MPDSPYALEIAGLSKSFDRPVVKDLELRVKGGEFYALLGPNGAGKTTILRMVAGLLQPEAGTISVFGIDTRETRSRPNPSSPGSRTSRWSTTGLPPTNTSNSSPASGRSRPGTRRPAPPS